MENREGNRKEDISTKTYLFYSSFQSFFSVYFYLVKKFNRALIYQEHNNKQHSYRMVFFITKTIVVGLGDFGIFQLLLLLGEKAMH